MSKIVLTGASGLTGSHIAEYFVSKGLDVKCIVRRSSNINFLQTLGVQIEFAELSNQNEVNNALIGADFIIHTAAMVSDWGKYEDFYLINVIGTLNILKAAKLNGINNVIITGSISCYGEESNLMVKDEEMDYNSHYPYCMDKVFPSSMNFYRDTKSEANLRAIEFCEVNKINLTVIEPAWIFGEREFHSGFYDFLKSVKSFPLIPGSKSNKFHTIYARDLAKIYYLAYQKKLQGINKILAVAPKCEYQFRILNLMCEKAGLKLPKRIPKFLAYPPAFVLELIYKIFKINNSPLLSRARVNLFYDNIEYSPNKAIALLGFKSDYTFEESIENTIKWYKDNKYL